MHLPKAKGRVEAWTGRIPNSELWLVVFYGPYRYLGKEGIPPHDCMLTIRVGLPYGVTETSGFGDIVSRHQGLLTTFDPIAIAAWLIEAREACGVA
jgi:hypothetical protein